jgi:hypothetical protein
LLRAFVEKELISDTVAENMLSWPRSGFHVHLGPLIHEDEGKLLKTTARYCARAPLSLSRLRYHSEAWIVTYTYTNPYDNTEATERITPQELIARLCAHIPSTPPSRWKKGWGELLQLVFEVREVLLAPLRWPASPTGTRLSW